MQINWFEIIAQMINFFVLLFILQKLLYKPVIKSMKERQQRITDSQNEADQKIQEANHLIATYQQKMLEWETSKENLMATASREALENKEALIQLYRDEAAQQRSDYLSVVAEEQQHFLHELRMVLGNSAVTIAGQILSTISTENLDEQIFAAFIKKLQALDQAMLQSELKSTEDKIVLISASPLSLVQQRQVEKVLKEKLARFDGIVYEVDQKLIQGFELNLRSLSVHTNMKHYLEEAEVNIENFLAMKNH